MATKKKSERKTFKMTFKTDCYYQGKFYKKGDSITVDKACKDKHGKKTFLTFN